MADQHYHVTPNKVELAFELAALPPFRIAMHWTKAGTSLKRKNDPDPKVFGECLMTLVEPYAPIAWYDVHRKSHFIYGMCAVCGKRAATHHN